MSLSPDSQDLFRPLLREMIHAINNPLGVILGSAQFALEGIEGKEVTQLKETDLRDARESLRVIERQARRCAQLVRRMRALVVAGEIQREPVDLLECLRSALQQVPWPTRGIEVQEEFPESGLRIQGDREKLREAFGVLVRNAFEAQPDGGEVRVSVRAEARGLEVCLADRGAGIAPEQLPLLFHPLFSTKTGEERGGGLSLARVIFEAHGASLGLESAPGAGTRATVRFPAEAAAAALPEPRLEGGDEAADRG